MSMKGREHFRSIEEYLEARGWRKHESTGTWSNVDYADLILVQLAKEIVQRISVNQIPRAERDGLYEQLGRWERRLETAKELG